MARGFRGSRGGLQAPKRQIANEGVEGFATMTFGASASAVVAGTVGAALTAPAATLVRTRGLLSARVDASGASNAIITGVMGLIVVSLEAFTVGGITSLPTPIDDTERAWVVWQPFSLTATATTPDQGSFGLFSQFPIDSRGMRKMKRDDLLAIIFEGLQVTTSTGTVVKLAYELRFQFKT